MITLDADAVLLRLRSAAAVTGVVAVEDSLPVAGSLVLDATFAVLLMLPLASGATVTTRVNAAVPGANVGLLHDSVPPLPTAGVLQLQPAGALSEVKLVDAGIALLRLAAAALLGPAFVTLIV